MKYVITIGNFDGLHIGHKQIIAKTVELAKNLDAKSKLITFKNHTRDLSNMILDHEDKLEMIKYLGIDEVEELSFDEIKSMEPQDFMREYFNNATAVVVGEDFRFGKNRAGNSEDIIAFGKEHNIDVNIVKDLVSDGEKISSTKIRELIEAGDFLKASELLGYDFYVKSTVQNGYKRGSTLGFKTANIAWQENIIVPKYGVYYTQIEIAGEIFDAMTMVGVAKTFNKEFSCETYIFNFDREIYGEKIKLIFKEFLRENRKFDSKEDLISQLKRDKIKSIELAVKHNNHFTN